MRNYEQHKKNMGIKRNYPAKIACIPHEKAKKDGESIDLQSIYDIISEEKICKINQFKIINKITRNKIRTLLVRWFSPTEGHMKKESVVEEIYWRITEKIEGRIDYYTGKTNAGQNRGRYVYILIVRQKNILFIDENRCICYIVV